MTVPIDRDGLVNLDRTSKALQIGLKFYCVVIRRRCNSIRKILIRIFFRSISTCISTCIDVNGFWRVALIRLRKRCGAESGAGDHGQRKQQGKAFLFDLHIFTPSFSFPFGVRFFNLRFSLLCCRIARPPFFSCLFQHPPSKRRAALKNGTGFSVGPLFPGNNM